MERLIILVCLHSIRYLSRGGAFGRGLGWARSKEQGERTGLTGE